MVETLREATEARMDDAGCISYQDAFSESVAHGAGQAFLALYGSAIAWPMGVDAGEWLSWLGY